MKKFLIILILCFCAQIAYSYEYFDLGKSAYENGHFGQAKEYFGIAVKNKPKNVTAKYYYALSLMQLGELDAAAEQFQAITLSKPNSYEGQKSARALESLKKYFETKAGDYKLPEGSTENYMQYIIMENKDIKRWEKTPIDVYIQSSDSATIVEKAFNTWEEKSDGIIKFRFVPTTSEADISVIFVEKLPLINSEGGAIDGITSVKYLGKNINHADISIMDRDYKTKEVFSPEKIYVTALHNIGHAIGLNTHSESEKDIMYWNLTKENPTVSQADVNTLKLLYGISEQHLANIHENPSIRAIRLNSAQDYAEAYPNLPIAWGGLASAYVAVNDYDNAIDAIKKAIDLEPSDPVLYTQLAGYYEKLGQVDLSIQNYKQAYDLQPDNKVYLYNWAKACYKNKRTQEAKADVETYLMGEGFLANDDISRILGKMYKQDKEKTKQKIKKNREAKEKKAKEIEETEQEMFVD